MRIVFIGHSASRSGAPRSLLRIMQCVQCAYDVPIECVLLKGGDIVDEYKKLGRVTVINKHSSGRLGVGQWIPWKLRHAHMRAELRKCLSRRDIGLVFFNSAASASAGDVIAKCRCPVIGRIAEMASQINAYGADRVARLCDRAENLFAVSEATRADLISMNSALKDKTEILHGFIEPKDVVAEKPAARRLAIRSKLGISNSAIVVGGVGSPGWRKGTDLFVLAAREVISLIPDQDVHFVWVGGKADQSDIEPHRWDVARLGLTDRIHFVGTSDKVKDFFATFDVYAMTSREDPFPLVVLEAAANALPVVCFAGSGGAPEFVGDDCGTIVPHLDVPGMASAITKIALCDRTRSAYGECGRTRVNSQFSMEAAAQRVNALVGRFINGRRSR